MVYKSIVNIEDHKFIINNNGYFGIGTTNPVAKFQIGEDTQNITGTNSILFQVDSTLFVTGGTTPRRVGIGKIPKEDLDIDGNIQISSGGTEKITFYDNRVDHDHEHGKLLFTNDGINGSKFEVFTLDETGGGLNENLTIKYNGNTGIGTTNPIERLDVAGGIKLSGALTVGTNPNKGTDGQFLISKGTNPVEWADSSGGQFYVHSPVYEPFNLGSIGGLFTMLDGYVYYSAFYTGVALEYTRLILYTSEDAAPYTGYIGVAIYSDSSGSPGGKVFEQIVNYTSALGQGEEIAISLTNSTELTSYTKYWLAISTYATSDSLGIAKGTIVDTDNLHLRAGVSSTFTLSGFGPIGTLENSEFNFWFRLYNHTLNTPTTNSIAINVVETNNLVSNTLPYPAGDSLTFGAQHNILLGSRAGEAITNGNDNVCIGENAGKSITDTTFGINIGGSAGLNADSHNHINIGNHAGANNTGARSINIGNQSGYTRSGDDSINIGTKSNYDSTNPYNNTIILNATGDTLNSDGTNRFYVKPVRDYNGSNSLHYNHITGEITYSKLLSTYSDTHEVNNTVGQIPSGTRISSLRTSYNTLDEVVGKMLNILPAAEITPTVSGHSITIGANNNQVDIKYGSSYSYDLSLNYNRGTWNNAFESDGLTDTSFKPYSPGATANYNGAWGYADNDLVYTTSNVTSTNPLEITYTANTATINPTDPLNWNSFTLTVIMTPTVTSDLVNNVVYTNEPHMNKYVLPNPSALVASKTWRIYKPIFVNGVETTAVKGVPGSIGYSNLVQTVKAYSNTTDVIIVDHDVTHTIAVPFNPNLYGEYDAQFSIQFNSETFTSSAISYPSTSYLPALETIGTSTYYLVTVNQTGRPNVDIKLTTGSSLN